MSRMLLLWIGLTAVCICTGHAKTADRSIRADHPAIRYMGRTQISDAGDVAFDWVGTYFETVFTGGRIAAKLSDRDTSYYNVFIDEALHKVIKVYGHDTIVQLAGGLSPAAHCLRVQKRTEGEFGGTIWQKFLLPPRGTLRAPASRRQRQIEFIGNSITCGFGVEGKSPTEPFKLATENCDLSYASVIARFFAADYTLIAHSGRGAVRNYGDTVRVSAHTMREKMLQTFDEDPSQAWGFKTYHPDLVVINLGTNDFSLEPKPFEREFIESYTTILKQVRTHYGAIPIVCVYPPSVPTPVFSYYEAAVASMHDAGIHLIRLDKKLLQPEKDYGAVYHPNYSGQRKLALSLIPFIATITGWELSDRPVR